MKKDNRYETVLVAPILNYGFGFSPLDSKYIEFMSILNSIWLSQLTETNLSLTKKPIKNSINLKGRKSITIKKF